MPADDYTSTPSTGKLKLKGITDGRIDKKKKKKKPKPESAEAEAGVESTAQPSAQSSTNATDFTDNSVMLRTLQSEDAQITKDNNREVSLVGSSSAISPSTAGEAAKTDDVRDQMRTDAERRFEEQRRKRLEERLKREGVKTHKQRVEELNKYLSGLSEHHDMPKIGPG